MPLALAVLLEVLLALLVHERPAEDSPEPALRREAHLLRERHAQRGRSVPREVHEEVERARVVRAEVQRRGGDPVGFGRWWGGRTTLAA